jgi:DNA-binding Xre family transcriptional regulator
MLKFSLEKVASARGIDKKYKFLVKHGFTPTTATKLATGDVEYLRLEYIERLSTLLNCTPNDLFEWIPDSRSEDKPGHPLQSIKKSEVIDFSKTLRSLPINKIKEVETLLKSIN